MLVVRKALAALAVLLLMGWTVMAESPQPPPQTPKVKIEQKSNGTAKSQSNANTQTKATEPITPTENQRAAENAERHTDDEAEKRAQEASEYGIFFGRRLKITDALLALFTLFLVLVGIGQGIFLYRTDQGTHKAAEAAQKAAEVAEKSLTSTERAFVFLKYAYASPVFTADKKIAGWDIHIV
jgi:type IV secretory pathway VirB10-like protein